MTLTNQEMYNEIKLVMTTDLYNWLKTEFSDICSNGDIIINSNIDDMYNNISIPLTKLNLISYIYDRWKESYLSGKAADPWWAS